MQPPIKGRGTGDNREGRFESRTVEAVEDGWWRDEEIRAPATEVRAEVARSIIAHNNSPDIPFNQSINPYRGCEHGCVYCADGETQILMADGRTKMLGDLVAGEEIFGTVRRGWYRRYVRTQVLAHWQTRKPAHRVTLADGTTLIVSGDHRLLTERGWKFITGSEQGHERRPHLTTGNKLMGFGRVAPHVSQQRDIAGQAIKSSADLRVVDIEPLGGPRDLFDISTGTGDFVANGVISHNCYARPTHAYVNLSSGLDFETKLFYKRNAAELLESELSKRNYRPETIHIGASTDPYQPIEREHRVTRSILEVLLRFRHPCTITTKSHLVLRDLDLLQELAKENLCYVMVSLTTLDQDLKRGLEPRAPSPAARLKAIAGLARAAVPVGVLAAPMIPALNDHELERILESAAGAGADVAGYVLLRLPFEVKDLFEGWLRSHVPLRAEHVLSRIRAMRGGDLNDPRFGSRFKGRGVEAQLLKQRFEIACRRFQLNRRRQADLNTKAFRVPVGAGGQLLLDGL
jgi:DNA repair photolyase